VLTSGAVAVGAAILVSLWADSGRTGYDTPQDAVKATCQGHADPQPHGFATTSYVGWSYSQRVWGIAMPSWAQVKRTQDGGYEVTACFVGPALVQRHELFGLPPRP
jgi:hypothetical protein